jgi:hypothetical protein
MSMPELTTPMYDIPPKESEVRIGWTNLVDTILDTEAVVLVRANAIFIVLLAT